MTAQSVRPRPAWMASTPESDDKLVYQWFAIRLAALYQNPKGSVAELSKALGRSPNFLNQATRQKGITPETAIELEALLGREDFPREFFRPDIFLLA